jgi:threonine synthase
MQLYSTKNPDALVDLREAVFKGLPDDNGLYMPTVIPKLKSDFIKNLKQHSFQSIAYEISKRMLQGAVSDTDVKRIVESAIDFPAPTVQLDETTHILELFHGPSLAFKDFGARFMAKLMGHFNQKESRELVILVATSGDTGGAVAAGFHETPGIQVVILYPSGKVSHLQEQQLTTLGKNITALEVNGTFDDCQALVKQAFLDRELTENIRLSSANSINIARLIPQMFYYFEAYKQVSDSANPDEGIVYVVPSGNFGNLTAGVMAKKMGLPVHRFVAATNKNDIFPKYLDSGEYQPRPSVRTLSNAMDVGNPSNFARMEALHGIWQKMKVAIAGFSFDDAATEAAVREVYEQYKYIIDPHGAVGYLAWRAYQRRSKQGSSRKTLKGIILETAHPSKFLPDMERILAKPVEVPEKLAILANRKKVATPMGITYEPFKHFLLEKYSVLVS